MSEAHGHLERIRRRLGEGHRDLYHDLALYLQVLRDGLLEAVQQAVFHVATQVVPERYQQLNDRQRQELPRRLEQLVQRCGCLLTLEQLLVLARQVQNEQRRQGQQHQRRLARALAQMSAGADEGQSEGDWDEREEAEGSIRLDLNLPLSAELFSGGIPALAGLAGLVEPTSKQIAGEKRHDEGEGEDRLDEDFDIEGGDDEAEEDDDLEGSGLEGLAGLEGLEGLEPFEAEEAVTAEAEADDPTDILRALLVMAVPPERRSQVQDPDQPRPDTSTRPQPQRSNDADRNQGLVPQQPEELLEWWKALDQALQRRLRNLSHAINLDLIKLGLTRSLLPLNLLDAVLQGDLEALPAPANLLKIQLPFSSPDMPIQVQALGVLLRTSDLEYEQPRLRTCRRRLEQRRASVRKMAQQYRHWQRRARALEAEEQWMQDSQSTPESPA
ncbi:hypothetical protein KBZ18_00290 [Synechococcus sp. Cruz-9H2]|uniref:hypothetical protein n=1 Tax=unclassified Synechococcus TaxID=2626047 RepID=UPI0020CC6BBF|nr:MULTISPECIES: hypothetical protein [unclassified Synechococcus]MCP9817927.1 hypothetical protein [Synechococcus sp. Cruz-9H2]MCP9854323.1 hypothetical protein [Synechococcus sp. Cruz-9C9]MCP9868835.1 hypothetical protein [Synechococcus sp. Cruz-7B9]